MTKLFSFPKMRLITFFVIWLAVTVVGGSPDQDLVIEIHRIVAIGDIHGDVENFVNILRLADLVEDSPDDTADYLQNPPRWKFSSAGPLSGVLKTTLVQMGDLIDRGEQDLESLNVAFSLQEQTAKAGLLDKVVLLLGNHELLNLEGYYHYVNPNNYGGFLTKKLREEAMKPGGVYSKYIVDNFKAVHMDEDAIFVHAGFEIDASMKDIDHINDDIRVALRNSQFRHPLFRSNGPLWTRKMITDSMSSACENIEEILENFNASRIIVGHTPQASGHIEQYCDGSVIAVDVGVSRWMYNKIAALELLTVKYMNEFSGSTYTRRIVTEIGKGTKPFASRSTEFNIRPNAKAHGPSTDIGGVDEDL